MPFFLQVKQILFAVAKVKSASLICPLHLNFFKFLKMQMQIIQKEDIASSKTYGLSTAILLSLHWALTQKQELLWKTKGKELTLSK
jgi:hypothetical protein